MLSFLYPNVTFVICKNIVTMPSIEEREKIIFDYHNDPSNYHKGIRETADKIRQLYKWKNMYKEITEFIIACPTCQLSKFDRKNRTQTLNVRESPNKPFEVLSVDLFFFDNKKMLTIVENLTKFAQAYIISDKTPETIINKLKVYFSLFGIPKRIMSDHGGEFKNKKINIFCESLNILWHFTSSEYHQSNGMIERFHATITDTLRSYLLEHNQCDLEDALLVAINSYNSSKHSSTSTTPYNLVFPYKNNDEFDQMLFDNKIATVREKQSDLRKTQKNRFDNLKTRKLDVTYIVGDKILVKRPRNPNTPKAILNTGPYVIIEVNNNNKTLKIQLDNGVIRKFHFNSVKPFYDAL